jgi:hypothetical protein
LRSRKKAFIIDFGQDSGSSLTKPRRIESCFGTDCDPDLPFLMSFSEAEVEFRFFPGSRPGDQISGNDLIWQYQALGPQSRPRHGPAPSRTRDFDWRLQYLCTGIRGSQPVAEGSRPCRSSQWSRVQQSVRALNRDADRVFDQSAPGRRIEPFKSLANSPGSIFFETLECGVTAIQNEDTPGTRRWRQKSSSLAQGVSRHFEHL